MTNKKTLSHFGSIADVDGKVKLTDQQIIDAVDAVEKKHEVLSKELEKKQSSDEIRAKYQYAHWFCHPRCGFRVDRDDSGAIQQHKEKCAWQIELREARQADKEAWGEGVERMRFILSSIEKELSTIEATQRRIEEERKLKRGDWETYINKYLQKNINNARASIFSLNKQKHSLLNHVNEITREASQQMYNRYEKMTLKQRSRGDWK